MSLRSSIESHARFADNRISTSGRAEDLDLTVTVWTGKRRGSITGNDASPAALAQMAADAVEIARISPVHREYVPTLGPLDYPESRGFAAATADVDVERAGAALEGVLAACRDGQGHRGRLPHRAGRRDRHGDGQRQPALLSHQRRRPQHHGAQRGRHRLGLLRRAITSISARLDATRRSPEAVGKAVRSQNPKAIEPAAYPVILEPQAVADLLGFLTNAFDARTADEGRSAFSAKDGKTRLGEKLFDERLNLYSDPMHADLPAAAEHRRRHSGDADVAHQGGRAREPRVLALLGAGAQARADARAGQLHPREHAAAGLGRRDDQGHSSAAC